MATIERKLARKVRIDDIKPIEGADAIEVATVGGWKVVVKKGEFNIGDTAIYCEIDSFLPIRPEFEFLRASSFRKMGEQEGFRLRSAKLRGQVSQGLLLPISLIEGYEGDDIADFLGIIKYEPPIPACLAGKVLGNFPSSIQRTDEERIQNLEWGEIRDKLKNGYIATEKLDGTSFTAYIRDDGSLGVCSRNLELAPTEGNTHWKIAAEANLEEKLRAFTGLAIQGEVIGEGVNGNLYKLKGQHLRIFNVFDMNTFAKKGGDEAMEIAAQMGLDFVPRIELPELPETIEELLALAERKSLLNPAVEAEGMVIRSLDGQTSFKVISNKWLLKHE